MAIDDKKLDSKKRKTGKPAPDVLDMLDAMTSYETTPSHQESSLELAQLEIENDELRKILEKNAIVELDKKSFRFRNFLLTKTGLQIDGEIRDEDVDALGWVLKKLTNRLQFLQGDWVNLYLTDDMDDNQRSDVYKNLARVFGIEHQTLKQFASVCRKIPASRRRDTLSFSHHQEVAFLPDELKGREEEFLNKAVEGDDGKPWSVRRLRDEIKSESAKALPKPNTLDTIIDVKPMKKQFNQVTKLYRLDPQTLDDKKRDEYRGKIVALRRVLDELENKLDQ